jgi:hypothetical protein
MKDSSDYMTAMCTRWILSASNFTPTHCKKPFAKQLAKFENRLTIQKYQGMNINF